MNNFINFGRMENLIKNMNLGKDFIMVGFANVRQRGDDATHLKKLKKLIYDSQTNL